MYALYSSTHVSDSTSWQLAGDFQVRTYICAQVCASVIIQVECLILNLILE